MGANRSRYAGLPRLIPTWAATLGAMKAEETKVSATCTSCGHYRRRVDLDAMIARYGAEHSLFDWRPACEASTGCQGTVLFMYGCEGGPMRPCKTD